MSGARHIGTPAIRDPPIGRLPSRTFGRSAGWRTSLGWGRAPGRGSFVVGRAPRPDAPGRVWRDWALVSALVPVVVLEGAFREDLVWRALSMAVALALLPTLLWRRTHPLQSVAAAFGLLAVVQVASLILGDDWRGLDANVFVILLVYALFRWGSGRDAVIGLAILSIPVLLQRLRRPDALGATRSR